MAEIAIVGAGLTGLSAAYHLEKKGFFNYTLFEKEASPGGLCRSISQDGFTFDYTGHLLHISDPAFQAFIEQQVGLEHFIPITRKSFIYSKNTYTRYPFQINLCGLPADVITECISGYVNRPKSSKKPRSFYDWVMQSFGHGFGNHFFFNYQKKIFDYDIHQLTASWTGRFVPKTSLEEMLMGALSESISQEIGYNARFLYPREGGIFFWLDRLHKCLTNQLQTEHEVISIDIVNKSITFKNGHEERYEQLITTMPLNMLLGLIKEGSRTTLHRAQSKLLCNSVTNFNLGIQGRNISEKHWIYFPEDEFPFYRLGFPHNFTPTMAPPGCSSLYGEFSHLNKSIEYQEQHLKDSLIATRKLFNITDKDIATEVIINIPHAYVIYNEWRDKNVPKILTTLASYDIYSVGRYGEWKYASMQEGFLDGKKIADNLVVMPAQREIDYFLSRNNSSGQQLSP